MGILDSILSGIETGVEAVVDDPIGALSAIGDFLGFGDDEGNAQMVATSPSAGNSMTGGAGGVSADTMKKVQMAAAMGDQRAAAVLAALGMPGATAGPVQCPTLFRARAQGSYLPSRIQVAGPDGQIYVLANLGRATRGSREGSVMKRLAKQNGFVVKRRTSPSR